MYSAPVKGNVNLEGRNHMGGRLTHSRSHDDPVPNPLSLRRILIHRRVQACTNRREARSDEHRRLHHPPLADRPTGDDSRRHVEEDEREELDAGADG